VEVHNKPASGVNSAASACVSVLVIMFLIFVFDK